MVLIYDMKNNHLIRELDTYNLCLINL